MVSDNLEQRVFAPQEHGRRDFLRMISTVGLSLLLPARVHSSYRCDDLFTPTYYGPMITGQVCHAHIDGIRYYEAQKDSQWCWAACIQMVFKHWGYDVQQPMIVKDAWGDIVNMPGTPLQILMSLNREWTDDSGKKFTVRSDSFVLGPGTLAQELAANRPPILGILGHAVVLSDIVYSGNNYGVTVNSANVLDPWPGRGELLLSPTEFGYLQFAARIQVFPDLR